MTTVVRIRRKDGMIIQNCDVYIGRAMYQGGWKLQKSIWANPFKVNKDGTREEVLELYKNYVLTSPELMSKLHELNGKILGCWCKPQPCHGDILIELINNNNLQ